MHRNKGWCAGVTWHDSSWYPDCLIVAISQLISALHPGGRLISQELHIKGMASSSQSNCANAQNTLEVLQGWFTPKLGSTSKLYIRDRSYSSLKKWQQMVKICFIFCHIEKQHLSFLRLSLKSSVLARCLGLCIPYAHSCAAGDFWAGWWPFLQQQLPLYDSVWF